MMVSRPVTNNANTDPVQGTLIMGRFVTNSYLAAITKQICLGFDWWNLKKEYTRSAMESYLSQITPQNPIFLEFMGDTVAAYAVLPDIDGNDAILIRSILTNSIASYRNELLVKGAITFLIEGSLFLIVLVAGVTRQCMRCPRLTQTVQSLPTSDAALFEHIAGTQNPDKNASPAGARHS